MLPEVGGIRFDGVGSAEPGGDDGEGTGADGTFEGELLLSLIWIKIA